MPNYTSTTVLSNVKIIPQFVNDFKEEVISALINVGINIRTDDGWHAFELKDHDSYVLCFAQLI